ncbi:hypothetical protein PoB_000220600 [Plakobranchus ocellatus]|uniref:Uncharacterized protein n=1 Tax=Plakobranchus ocellatus TaxID=259542 RepID=A0AAV3Y067_9GAST|nr:hypothetical protein PoB_000220600 [Plakobranchus ocellatus]
MENLGGAEVTEPSVNTSETVPTPTQENHFTLNLMLDLLKDDVYISLADHFLWTNRGRKPKLPDIPTLTNGVLLQLNLIKDEGQSSFRELKAWIEMLFPDTATVTEGRVTHRITSLLKQIEQGAKASLFLERVDFHKLPPALSNLGLN